MRAYMRVLGVEAHELDTIELPGRDVWCVAVPVFGHLIVTRAADHPNAAHTHPLP